jgi:CheY-like chemotaxis protein
MAILVVDDSRAMRMIVLRELRKAGYDTRDVLEAGNGREALERIQDSDVDLVLCDWNMPELNGMGLLRLLRRDGNDVPFGFVTSESTPLMHRDALDAGADFVVTKPFTADSLSLQVERVLEGRRQNDGLGAAVAPDFATFAGVLTDLLGRDVVTVKSLPPDLDRPGAVARYRSPSESLRTLLVAELSVVAAVGAALSRIPAGAVEDFITEGAVPDIVQQNFYEAVNVLSKVVPGYGERWAVEALNMFGELRDHADVALAGPDYWRQPMEVRVSGYPTGRVGFLRA